MSFRCQIYRKFYFYFSFKIHWKWLFLFFWVQRMRKMTMFKKMQFCLKGHSTTYDVYGSSMWIILGFQSWMIINVGLIHDDRDISKLTAKNSIRFCYSWCFLFQIRNLKDNSSPRCWVHTSWVLEKVVS